MKVRPIQFPQPHADEMVRAILDGRKTQMRRPVKPQPFPWAEELVVGQVTEALAPNVKGTYGMPQSLIQMTKDRRKMCGCGNVPLGIVGDRLWVRETWAAVDWCDKSAPRDFGSAVWYKADDSGPHAAGAIPYKTDNRGKWRHSIHMPRWASRITLEISSVRVEKVEDITEKDAECEGLDRITFLGDTFWKLTTPIKRREGGETIGTPYAKIAFQNFWQSTYGTWNANPWVWVYEFRRVKP